MSPLTCHLAAGRKKPVYGHFHGQTLLQSPFQMQYYQELVFASCVRYCRAATVLTVPACQRAARQLCDKAHQPALPSASALPASLHDTSPHNKSLAMHIAPCNESARLSKACRHFVHDATHLRKKHCLHGASRALLVDPASTERAGAAAGRPAGLALALGLEHALDSCARRSCSRFRK